MKTETKLKMEKKLNPKEKKPSQTDPSSENYPGYQPEYTDPSEENKMDPNKPLYVGESGTPEERSARKDERRGVGEEKSSSEERQ